MVRSPGCLHHRNRPPATVHHLYFIFRALRSAFDALERRSNARDQRAIETYLANVQSMSELEHRQRQWLRAHC